MSFDKIHSQRLTQLADRLDSDVPLLVGRFDFSVVRCGSAGCAMGESAMMWREYTCAEDWFGLTLGESSHLFMVNGQDVDRFGGQSLDDDATRQQVAANIRAFLAVKGAQEGAEA